jgi:hypothetical protein
MVSYETVRRWVNHFGPMVAAGLRRRRPKSHTTWHLDEVYLKIDGRMVYLWRPFFARSPKKRRPLQAMPVMARKTLRAPRVRLRGSVTANKMMGAVGIEPTTSPV